MIAVAPEYCAATHTREQPLQVRPVPILGKGLDEALSFTGEPVAAQRQCGQVERLSLDFEVGLQTLNLAVPFVRSRSRSIAVARVRPNESSREESHVELCLRLSRRRGGRRGWRRRRRSELRSGAELAPSGISAGER
jgi:hypothetical protein